MFYDDIKTVTKNFCFVQRKRSHAEQSDQNNRSETTPTTDNMRCNNQFDFGEIWQQEKMIRSWRD
jgi:hypothetical protein